MLSAGPSEIFRDVERVFALAGRVERHRAAVDDGRGAGNRLHRDLELRRILGEARQHAPHAVVDGDGQRDFFVPSDAGTMHADHLLVQPDLERLREHELRLLVVDGGLVGAESDDGAVDAIVAAKRKCLVPAIVDHDVRAHGARRFPQECDHPGGQRQGRGDGDEHDGTAGSLPLLRPCVGHQPALRRRRRHEAWRLRRRRLGVAHELSYGFTRLKRRDPRPRDTEHRLLVRHARRDRRSWLSRRLLLLRRRRCGFLSQRRPVLVHQRSAEVRRRRGNPVRRRRRRRLGRSR